MSDDRGRRVGLNESIFRQVNEQIEKLNRGFGGELPGMTIVCECASGDCTERLEIGVALYEKVRADPTRYLVIPGHELPEYEAVVERGEGYDVVQKREGGPAELARDLDPRS